MPAQHGLMWSRTEQAQSYSPAAPQQPITACLCLARCFWLQTVQQLSGRTGTLMYMAPEMYRAEQYDEKVSRHVSATMG